jgi:hypothetical protein
MKDNVLLVMCPMISKIILIIMMPYITHNLISRFLKHPKVFVHGCSLRLNLILCVVRSAAGQNSMGAFHTMVLVSLYATNKNR